MMKASLKQRILVPLYVGLLAIFIVFTALLYYSQQRYLVDTRERDRESVVRFFHDKLKDEASVMAALLANLQGDPRLRKPFEARDRAALLSVAAPMFDDLEAHSRVSNLYFVTPEGAVFLRMHPPRQFGDTIARPKGPGAGRSDELAYGLDVSKL